MNDGSTTMPAGSPRVLLGPPMGPPTGEFYVRIGTPLNGLRNGILQLFTLCTSHQRRYPGFQIVTILRRIRTSIM